jgi:hypothetical protein
MLIKVVPACRHLLPVFSSGLSGGHVLLKEEYCQLPKGHAGPHRGASGGVLENTQWNLEQLERGR